MATPTSLRMPDELRDKVAGLARRERRSFSAQAVTLIEAGLAARATPALPEGEREVLDALRVELDAREVDRA